MLASCSAHPSSSAVLDLPPLSVLGTWVHRPQAVAKCSVSDCLSLAALTEPGGTLSRNSREIFLLNRFPCRVVELVAWVAGVDHKEASMQLTLDGGDGRSTIVANVPLQRYRAPAPSARAAKTSAPLKATSSTTFISRAERLAAKQGRQSDYVRQSKPVPIKPIAPVPAPPMYVRKDVRVGDTVRVVGKVEDWFRARAGGGGEWIRQLYINEAMGGSIDEEEYHSAVVAGLHETLYCRPFKMPTVEVAPTQPTRAVHASPATSTACASESLISYADSMSMEPSSYADASSLVDEPELRHPAKLRSSQLTLRTFELYLNHHMRAVIVRSLDGSPTTDPIPALQALFPEYRQATQPVVSLSRKLSRTLSPTTRDNVGGDTTPLAKSFFQPKAQREAEKLFRLSQEQSCLATSTQGRKQIAAWPPIRPFTTPSILADPVLGELAARIVEADAKRVEQARRQRMRAHAATDADRLVEVDRVRRGLARGEWRPDAIEAAKLMERLVESVIRSISAQTTALVPVRVENEQGEGVGGHGYGYVPALPEIVAPLLIALMRQATPSSSAGQTLPTRAQQRGGGMSTEQLLRRLRAWGEDGRWERVGLYVVVDAVEHGEAQGILRRAGAGWVVAD